MHQKVLSGKLTNSRNGADLNTWIF